MNRMLVFFIIILCVSSLISAITLYQLQILQYNNTRLQGAIEELESKYASLNTEYFNLKEEHNLEMSGYNNLKSEHSTLKKQYSTLESRYNNLDVEDRFFVIGFVPTDV